MVRGLWLAWGAMGLMLALAACKEGITVAGVRETPTPTVTATPAPPATPTVPPTRTPAPTRTPEAETLDPELEERAIRATVLAFFEEYNRGAMVSAVARLSPPTHVVCGGTTEHWQAYERMRATERLTYLVTELEVVLQEGGRDALVVYSLDSFPFGETEPAQEGLRVSVPLRRESVLWQFQSEPLPHVLGFCLNLTEGAN